MVSKLGSSFCPMRHLLLGLTLILILFCSYRTMPGDSDKFNYTGEWIAYFSDFSDRMTPVGPKVSFKNGHEIVDIGDFVFRYQENGKSNSNKQVQYNFLYRPLSIDPVIENTVFTNTEIITFHDQTYATFDPETRNSISSNIPDYVLASAYKNHAEVLRGHWIGIVFNNEFSQFTVTYRYSNLSSVVSFKLLGDIYYLREPDGFLKTWSQYEKDVIRINQSSRDSEQEIYGELDEDIYDNPTGGAYVSLDTNRVNLSGLEGQGPLFYEDVLSSKVRKPPISSKTNSSPTNRSLAGDITHAKLNPIEFMWKNILSGDQDKGRWLAKFDMDSEESLFSASGSTNMDNFYIYYDAPILRNRDPRYRMFYTKMPEHNMWKLTSISEHTFKSIINGHYVNKKVETIFTPDQNFPKNPTVWQNIPKRKKIMIPAYFTGTWKEISFSWDKSVFHAQFVTSNGSLIIDADFKLNPVSGLYTLVNGSDFNKRIKSMNQMKLNRTLDQENDVEKRFEALNIGSSEYNNRLKSAADWQLKVDSALFRPKIAKKPELYETKKLTIGPNSQIEAPQTSNILRLQSTSKSSKSSRPMGIVDIPDDNKSLYSENYVGPDSTFQRQTKKSLSATKAGISNQSNLGKKYSVSEGLNKYIAY